MTVSLEERFWAKVDRTDGCWLWTACIGTDGYGHFGVGSRTDGSRRTAPAHRIAYELAVGPVPAGLDLDHLCRNPSCVNPAHLEPVTHSENVRRGVGTAAINAAKTHCKYGHEFTPENTHICSNGHRKCKTCMRIYQTTRRRAAARSASRGRFERSFGVERGAAAEPRPPISPSRRRFPSS